MHTASSIPPRFVFPSEGEVLTLFGDELRIHLDGSHTNGRFTMLIDHLPPGGGSPRHLHRREDKWLYALDTPIDVLCGDAWIELPVGSTAFLPRGTIHAFRNNGDQPARMMIHTMPAGIERFLRGCAAAYAAPGGPNPGVIAGIAAEHGIVLINR